MDKLLSISQMANIHGLTRQTLIYYDEINLFKPAKIDDKGYRYYSLAQIPFLREICYLKHLGVELKDIVRHFEYRRVDKEVELLQRQKRILTQQITKLNQMRQSINLRLSLYDDALDAKETNSMEPFIKFSPEIRVAFKEYIQPINKNNLHLTMMDIWNHLYKKNSLPPCGFGSIYRKTAIDEGEDIRRGAGSCLFLYPWDSYDGEVITFPAGEYACMYKYGMPYESSYIEQFLSWLNENELELIGDVLDICLLDTTFYSNDTQEDFCLIQAPVRLKKF